MSSALAIVVSACHPRSEPVGPPAVAMPLDRIAIVGASVSAGFGGLSFEDAFRQAAPHAAIASEANVMLFRDPVGETRAQLDRAIAFHPSAVIALDLLFWDAYGSTAPAWRTQALTAALDGLERARAAGAWIVVGDIPLITTAAEWMLPRSQVPDPAALDQLDREVTRWATGRERVILVPLAAWTAPLRAGGNVEIAPGETVAASTLVAVDGLHANPLGTWWLLDRLDHLIETTAPGTPKSALVFVRPK